MSLIGWLRRFWVESIWRAASTTCPVGGLARRRPPAAGRKPVLLSDHVHDGASVVGRVGKANFIHVTSKRSWTPASVLFHGVSLLFLASCLALFDASGVFGGSESERAMLAFVLLSISF